LLVYECLCVKLVSVDVPDVALCHAKAGQLRVDP